MLLQWYYCTARTVLYSTVYGTHRLTAGLVLVEGR